MKGLFGVLSIGALILSGFTLGGCDPNPTENQLPGCLPGQALGTDGAGGLVCKEAPTVLARLPECKEGEVLQSDGVNLRCVASLDADTQRLLVLWGEISRLSTSVKSGVQNRHPGQYVGVSIEKTNGNSMSGTDNGILGAAKICAATHAPATRICTPYDLYQSMLTGALSDGTSLPLSRVFYSAWVGMAEQLEPEMGLGDNCASLTYPTASTRWLGATVEFGVLPTGAVGVDLRLTYCYFPLPVACCR